MSTARASAAGRRPEDAPALTAIVDARAAGAASPPFLDGIRTAIGRYPARVDLFVLGDAGPDAAAPYGQAQGWILLIRGELPFPPTFLDHLPMHAAQLEAVDVALLGTHPPRLQPGAFDRPGAASTLLARIARSHVLLRRGAVPRDAPASRPGDLAISGIGEAGSYLWIEPPEAAPAPAPSAAPALRDVPRAFADGWRVARHLQRYPALRRPGTPGPAISILAFSIVAGYGALAAEPALLAAPMLFLTTTLAIEAGLHALPGGSRPGAWRARAFVELPFATGQIARACILGSPRSGVARLDLDDDATGAGFGTFVKAMWCDLAATLATATVLVLAS